MTTSFNTAQSYNSIGTYMHSYNHQVGAILNDPQKGDCWSIWLLWNLNLRHNLKWRLISWSNGTSPSLLTTYDRACMSSDTNYHLKIISINVLQPLNFDPCVLSVTSSGNRFWSDVPTPSTWGIETCYWHGSLSKIKKPLALLIICMRKACTK